MRQEFNECLLIPKYLAVKVTDYLKSIVYHLLLLTKAMRLLSGLQDGVVDREVFGIEGESLKPNKANPQRFSELFYTEKDYLVSIEALRTIKAIDEANQNLIGYTLKGVMQVWIDILRNERGCLKQVNDALLTILLNKEFTGLNIGEKSEGRHFRNPINKTAKARYRPKLLALIRES